MRGIVMERPLFLKSSFFRAFPSDTLQLNVLQYLPLKLRFTLWCLFLRRNKNGLLCMILNYKLI